MAKQDFLSNIDRRRLLISAAAVTAASIGSREEAAEAANVTTFAQPLSPAPAVQSLNVCAATRRRLLEISGAMKSVGRLNCRYCPFQGKCAE
jgi:hypothetical protein